MVTSFVTHTDLFDRSLSFVQLNILHPLNVLDAIESQKLQAGGQSYKFKSDVSELLPLVSQLCQL